MSRVFLKIKIKSLAAEATIIRAEERKRSGDLRTSLYLHRIQVVRRECRAALLAYGFLRGRWYAQLEGPGTDPYCISWPRVLQLVNKYGNLKLEADVLKAWAKGGEPLPKPAKLAEAA